MYYQEYNKRKQISIAGIISMVFLVFIFLIVVNFIFASLNVQGFVDLFSLLFIFFLCYCYIRKNSLSYKYMLISNEFIVQQVVGHKEKVLININLEQIVQFKPIESKQEIVVKNNNTSLVSTTKNKFYNCWSWNSKDRYFCVYNDNGKTKYFEVKPSEKFIKLINSKLGEYKKTHVNMA